ncbi:MAG: Mini-circle protein [Pseudonocardia sp. SCN 72-86]|nr:MAG: Mini-circle protein [Pseudonocardia sp. SCN 72-86]
MTWTSPFPAQPPTLPITDGPITGDELPILLGMLARQRSCLVNVCAELTPAQLTERALPPSTLSLLGLVRHLAKVERIWLRQRIAGQDVAALYGGPGDDSDFDDADPAHAERDLATFVAELPLADAALAGSRLDDEIDFRGRSMSVRAVLLHMLTEYGRHLGHADMLRERVDGVTGR